METITLAGGCFWCTEAVFSQLKGVKKVISGYSGGSVENPTYEQVCGGDTGHAEAVQIEFDPKVIPLEKLLYVFFKLHDATQLNRQGADVGTQYRSAVFYSSEAQKKAATKAKAEILGSVTEIAEYTDFYPADPSHKEYYFKHRNSPYCMLVIDPKINKLKKNFGEYLKN